MEVKYNKTQTTENDTGKNVSLTFNGTKEGIKMDLKISGSRELIGEFMSEHNLTHYGQVLNLSIKNEQQTLEEDR